MVSADEAKEILNSAYDFANGDPEDRIQDFFLAAERVPKEDSDRDDEYLDIGKIPFHKHIHTELNVLYVESLFKVVRDVVRNEDKPLSKYQAGNIEEEVVPIQYLPVDEIPNYGIFEPFTQKSGFDEASYDGFESPEIQALRIRSRLADEMFVAFRKFSTRQIVGSSWKVKLTQRNSEYDIFKDDLVALPEKVDAFVYRGVMFVINQRKFEDMFDYFTEYKNSAETVFEEIEDSEFTIHTSDLFEKAVLSDRSALRKMVTVEERKLYDQLNRDTVQRVIDEFNLDVNLEERSGEWGLVMESRNDKRDIIRLLNDDHLYSELTDSRYQAQAKRPI